MSYFLYECDDWCTAWTDDGQLLYDGHYTTEAKQAILEHADIEIDSEYCDETGMEYYEARDLWIAERLEK